MRRLDNIDLRLLRVFLTIVEAGGFADAQISLNLSSSTLSTHLASLERIIGGQLCDRGRRGFRLTALGQSTYNAATLLFADIDTFQARIGRDRGRLVGRLLIGIVDGVAQLKAEKDGPRGDVWWGGTGDPHLQAAEEKLTDRKSVV